MKCSEYNIKKIVPISSTEVVNYEVGDTVLIDIYKVNKKHFDFAVDFSKRSQNKITKE